jgi:trehalose-6-phosphate synthase
MRKYERRDRHRALMKRIMQNDVNAWRESFLAALRGCGDRRQGGMDAN